MLMKLYVRFSEGFVHRTTHLHINDNQPFFSPIPNTNNHSTHTETHGDTRTNRKRGFVKFISWLRLCVLINQWRQTRRDTMMMMMEKVIDKTHVNAPFGNDFANYAFIINIYYYHYWPLPRIEMWLLFIFIYI